MNEREIYKKAIGIWGIESQYMMAIEECGELITAISHKHRGRKDNVIEEIADVKIMVEQLAIIFGEKQVEAVKREKILRLEERLLKKTFNKTANKHKE